jgi:hypothetical protein
MRIGEAPSVAREPIELGRLYESRAIAANISVTDIVGEYEDNVGSLGGSDSARRESCDQEN